MKNLQTWRRALSMVVITMGGLVACDDGDAESDGAAIQSIDEFLPTAASLICAREFECCPSGTNFESQADCEVAYGGLLRFLTAPIYDGRARFNGVGATRCVDAWRAASTQSCDADFEFVCPDFVEGTQGDGDVCGTRDDGFVIREPVVCQPGLVCVGNDDADPTCQPQFAIGDACDAQPDRCGADAFCAGRGQPDAACAPRVDLGEECQTNDACADDAECDFDEGVCVFLEAQNSMMCGG